MTAREWILKCYATAHASAKRREAKLAENKRGEVVHVIKRRDGKIVEKPWPPARPIGATPRQIFGDAKLRPQELGVVALEAELTAMRKEGILGFTSGVWWKR